MSANVRVVDGQRRHLDQRTGPATTIRLVLGSIIDTPDNPFTGGELRCLDGGLAVDESGEIVARGSWEDLVGQFPEAEQLDLSEGLLIPGMVDTHVHFPQVRIIGGLGVPLLDWLDTRVLPEEARLADRGYAEKVAAEFVSGMISSGTTTALAFGSHFADAVDAMFAEACTRGFRLSAGLVLGDRMLRDELHTTPERAWADSAALIDRWHSPQTAKDDAASRLRYAVTPRFSLSCSDPLLAVCGELMGRAENIGFTSHINENDAEIATVAELFPDSTHYLDTYVRHGLVGRGSVLAHNVHPTDAELVKLAESGAWVSHCPCSNAALGSGLFPMQRHVDAGVNLALGSDVGGGTGFSLFKEALQACFAQQLLRERGYRMTAAHMLYLATRAGALAVGRGGEVGDLSLGKQFDAVWINPRAGSTTRVVLDNAVDGADATTRVFAQATSDDIAGVWIAGHRVIDRARD